MKQGAKRPSHRWFTRSPKTGSSQPASQTELSVSGKLPLPAERRPRKPPKPSEKEANYGTSTTQEVLLSEYNVPNK